MRMLSVNGGCFTLEPAYCGNYLLTFQLIIFTDSQTSFRLIYK
jgi:hypothetical protein